MSKICRRKSRCVFFSLEKLGICSFLFCSSPSISTVRFPFHAHETVVSFCTRLCRSVVVEKLHRAGNSALPTSGWSIVSSGVDGQEVCCSYSQWRGNCHDLIAACIQPTSGAARYRYFTCIRYYTCIRYFTSIRYYTCIGYPTCVRYYTCINRAFFSDITK